MKTMGESPRRASVPEILEEHFEELGFLWAQRESHLDSMDWDLARLAEVEDRAERHLDALKIDPAGSIPLAREFLAADDAALATAATFVLLAADGPDSLRTVVDVLGEGTPPMRDGVRVGLRHHDVSPIAAPLTALAASNDPGAAAAAVDVLAFHRFPPPKGLMSLVGAPDPSVRALVQDAIGRFGGPWSHDLLTRALDDDHPPVRTSALRASARMGLPGLDDACRRAAARPKDPVPEALEFLGVVGGDGDLAFLAGAARHPQLAASGIAALGRLGRVGAIPTLLERIEDSDLALPASRAFTRITGHGTAGAIGSLAARDWWEEAKSRFSADGRWQAGRHVSKAPLGEGFDDLPLAVRIDLLLGARAADPSRTPDWELERKSSLQRR